MSTLDENGNVKRDADTIARLHAELIAAVPELTRLRAVPQPWGLVALHFDAALDDQEVLVKVGIRSKEAQTMRDLYRVAPDLVPRMYVEGTLASGLHYAAFERIPWGPLGPLWEGREFDLLCAAGARFYAAMATLDMPDLPTTSETQFLQALQHGLPMLNESAADLTDSAEEVLVRFSSDWAWLTDVFGHEPVHGDLHLGNGLTRTRPPGGPVILIDCQPRLQPWCFDPAYLEALNDGPLRHGAADVVATMATHRARLSLPVPDQADLARASQIAVGWYTIREWQHRWVEEPGVLNLRSDRLRAAASA